MPRRFSLLSMRRDSKGGESPASGGAVRSRPGTRIGVRGNPSLSAKTKTGCIPVFVFLRSSVNPAVFGLKLTFGAICLILLDKVKYCD